MVNPPAGELRVALGKRRRVAEMSPGELQRERGELRGISMKTEKTEHSHPELSIL